MSVSAPKSTEGIAIGTGFGSGRSTANLIRLARHHKTVSISLLLVVLIALVAIVGPVFTTYNPEANSVDSILKSPNGDHWFGTDELGRDIFTRVIYGLRYSLIVATGASLVVMVLGISIGLLSGYNSGRLIDVAILRVVDATLALPLLVLAMIIVGGLGSSASTVIFAIGLGLSPSVVRVIRSGVIAESSRDYVLAAKVVGASHLRVMVRHVLPNITSLVLVLASATIGFAILVESSLSFLGLGPPPEVPTLGRLLAVGGQRFWSTAPWMAIAPGLILVSVILIVNILGDALRDALDPRTRN